MNKKPPLNVMMAMDDGVMSLLKIPKIELIDGHEEIWTFVKLDRHEKFNKARKYLISNYGRVYNIDTKIMVVDYDGWKSKVAPYKSVSLYYNGKLIKYLKHRLVALAFIPKTDEDIKKGREFVNHIDGDPSHNFVWNLEWVNASENMLHAARTGLWKLPHGENRSTAKWSNDEIRFICSMMVDGHKATYIYHALMDVLKDPERVQYERVRTLYKHIKKGTHWKDIAQQYEIDYTPYDYSKEQASVEKKQAEQQTS